MKKNYFCFLVIFLVAVMLVAGCAGRPKAAPDAAAQQAGSDEGKGGAPGEAAATGDSGAVAEELPWLSLDNIVNLVSLVQEMSWSIGGIDGHLFHYAYLGQETLNGVPAEAVAMSVDDENIVLWVDGKGNILQAAINDDHMPAEMTGHMSMYMLAPLVPFQLSAHTDLQSALAGRKVPGWNVLRHDKTKDIIDGKSTTIHIMVIKARDPFGVGAGEYTVEYRFGDFGKMRLLLGFTILEGAEEGDEYVDFAIESITFR